MTAMRTALFRPGDRPLLNLALVALTLLSTFATFLFSFGGGSPDAFAGAAQFAVALVCILGAHEMGHYLLARKHQVDTTLPYFIPLPFLGVGTLGAVIRIRSRIPNRNALVDIGASGPLAGLAVAIPVLVVGLFLSQVAEAPNLKPPFPGEYSLWTLGQELFGYLRGRWAGASPEAVALPVSAMYWVFGDSLLMLGLQRLVVGPLPPGTDVFVHPLVTAGWFGLLVTMLNLLPIGQLDGGHLSFAVFGQRARWVGKLAALGLFVLCLFFSVAWVLWLVLTSTVIGFRHPAVIDPEQPLSRGRFWVSALCLLALVLCLTPIPLSQVWVP